MALPAKLKNMMLFNGGISYIGKVTEVTLPKLARKMEDYRAGGMDRPIKSDVGGEPLSMEWQCGGLMIDVLKQYGEGKFNGLNLRYVGAYTPEDSDDPIILEISVSGRHSEIDMGAAKPGGETNTKVKTEIAYYKLSADGVVLIEIDVINMIEMVDGKDRLAKTRQALGV